MTSWQDRLPEHWDEPEEPSEVADLFFCVLALAIVLGLSAVAVWVFA